jgi:hypothetical protein
VVSATVSPFQFGVLLWLAESAAMPQCVLVNFFSQQITYCWLQGSPPGRSYTRKAEQLLGVYQMMHLPVSSFFGLRAIPIPV